MGPSAKANIPPESSGEGSSEVGVPSKRVLVLYYSQSGQGYEIAKSVMSPLEESSSVEVVWQELQPAVPYPFPWPIIRLLDILPETVYMEPSALKPFSFDPDSRFDLIVLAYQVWYLSPSLPVTGFLKSSAARVLEGTPVITIVSCRDKWLMAQEKVKACLEEKGGRLLDNIAFTERGNQLKTLVCSLRWTLSGKRESRFLPPAGIDEESVRNARRFGTAILQALENGAIEKRAPVLKGLGAVKVDPKLIRPEQAAHRNFLFWGKLIGAVGKQGQKRRIPFLLLFLVALPCLVVLSLPFAILTMLVDSFRKEAMQKTVEYFEQPSGSSMERL
jgi:hypothetical protein